MTETLTARPMLRLRPTVAVYAADPVTRLSMVSQLRRSAGLVLVDPSAAPAGIAVVALDAVDDAALERLRALRRAGSRIVAVVPLVDARTILPAVAAGVRAVLSRPELTGERLLSAVRCVAAGGVDLPTAVVRYLVERVDRSANPSPDSRGLRLATLTPREREVLSLLAQGLSTREVATAMAYSERTIKNVLQELTTRLELRNRTQAVAYAVRHGWI
jgi:DNA-binding NarL/FixJ family response regulator